MGADGADALKLVASIECWSSRTRCFLVPSDYRLRRAPTLTLPPQAGEEAKGKGAKSKRPG